MNEARFSDEPEGEGFQPVIHASVAEHVHPPCCLTLDMLPEPARRGAAMCLDAALPALLALVSALATDAKALAAHASPADALHSPLLAATGAPQAVALSRLWLHCHAMGALHVLVRRSAIARCRCVERGAVRGRAAAARHGASLMCVAAGGAAGESSQPAVAAAAWRHVDSRCGGWRAGRVAGPGCGAGRAHHGPHALHQRAGLPVRHGGGARIVTRAGQRTSAH